MHPAIVSILESIASLLQNETVVLAIIGGLTYLVKRKLDNDSKKQEIKFNLFHQVKLKHMIDFQAAHFALEKPLRNCAKALIREERAKANLFIQEAQTALDKFNTQHEIVRFFNRDLERAAFDRVSKSLWHFYNYLFELTQLGEALFTEEYKDKLDGLKTYKHLVFYKQAEGLFESIFAEYRKEFEKDKTEKVVKALRRDVATLRK